MKLLFTLLLCFKLVNSTCTKVDDPPVPNNNFVNYDIISTSVSCFSSKFDVCARGGLYGVSKFSFTGNDIYTENYVYRNILSSCASNYSSCISNYFYGNKNTLSLEVLSVLSISNWFSSQSIASYICSNLVSDYYGLFDITINSSVTSMSQYFMNNYSSFSNDMNCLYYFYNINSSHLTLFARCKTYSEYSQVEEFLNNSTSSYSLTYKHLYITSNLIAYSTNPKSISSINQQSTTTLSEITTSSSIKQLYSLCLLLLFVFTIV